MLLEFQLLGAVISFCGGLYLFAADEDERRRKSAIVKVEACEERLCVRCGQVATVSRFDGRSWVYGATEACLYEHCRPHWVNPTACELQIIEPEPLSDDEYLQQWLRRGADMAVPLSATLDEELRKRLIREWATPRLIKE